MTIYRRLSGSERETLLSHRCTAENWDELQVAEGFIPEHISDVTFSGKIRLGIFEDEFTLPGGIRKHSGIRKAVLHNVTVGDNTCIENVNNYIANYNIGSSCFIENVDIILTDGESDFGNGVEVSVLNETGGREVMIYDNLSAQEAYVMALYRHRPGLISRMRDMVEGYTAGVRSDTGTIGDNVTIVDSGYIKNVRIGSNCKIEGSSRLKNGSINSSPEDPVHIGVGVIGDDFIISGGASVEDGTTFSRCFIGQACKLGHNYSASDSLFFSNCQGENGEACAIFAGPFTVTHHKSTLLIAGMFSFMNAGSGSNQSNHMYKLGPIHQGIMERGSKTTSDSYLLWPAKIGAFSLVMGRHVNNQDTSNFPFSYLIEQRGTSFLVPGVNLKSVGTIRDAKKWPKRDNRKGPVKLDCINYNLLSPYTIGKMLRGRNILARLKNLSGEISEDYTYQSCKIRNSALNKGLAYYDLAINKFLGNSIIKRLEGIHFKSADDVRKRLVPDIGEGQGEWVDLSGMIAPKSLVDKILDDIESGRINSTGEIGARFRELHSGYYEYEWTWAYGTMLEYYGLKEEDLGPETVKKLVEKWKESVVTLDKMVYDDAKKEFSLSAMTGFGADGDKDQKNLDFEIVRGCQFESNPFVREVLDHIKAKSALGDELLERLSNIGNHISGNHIEG
ncbi:MAG: DUF4954 family protein [Candidatus Cryptobacteroides sp.]